LKRKPTKRPRPRRKPKKATADVVADMAASGLVEDEIAQRLGVHKNVLRARHIDSIKAGKAAAAASEEAAAALTIEEFYVLNSITNSFASHWYHAALGNLIWPAANGKPARTIEDAFAAWKAKGGKFNVTGLSTKFDLVKAAEFAKIVSNYKHKQTQQEKTA
jgi:hypothetical protein